MTAKHDNSSKASDAEPDVDELKRVLKRVEETLSFCKTITVQHGELRDSEGSLMRLSSPIMDEIHSGLTRLRYHQAPLFKPKKKGWKSIIAPLLNAPIRLFGRKQILYDNEVMELLSSFAQLCQVFVEHSERRRRALESRQKGLAERQQSSEERPAGFEESEGVVQTGPQSLRFETPANLSSIFVAPAEQLPSERLLIYSLIFGLRPKHCLEIGTHWGGSAAIICAAMDDVGSGRLFCIDPEPWIAPELWERLQHRAHLIKGASPEVLSQALELSGSPFDFVFIDGDHTYSGVLRDIEGVLPFLADSAYILFHDSCHFEIGQAIDEALKRYPNEISDCGILSVETAPEKREVNGKPVLWGGLRLLRFLRKI